MASSPTKKHNLFTLDEALAGSQAPHDILMSLALVNVTYLNFDNQLCQGQLVIAQELVEEIKKIFEFILKEGFPIEKMVPIVHYGWDDTSSILDNNTSCFNFRAIAGTNQLSCHAKGKAIDINPKTNPYFNKEGISQPPGLEYIPEAKGALKKNDKIVQVFEKYGWQWGGNWQRDRGYVDFQHFEKINCHEE